MQEGSDKYILLIKAEKMRRNNGVIGAFSPTYNLACTGGTITQVTASGVTYNVHTFTSSGTLSLNIQSPFGMGNLSDVYLSGSATTASSYLFPLQYLIVAGGGGGGAGGTAVGNTYPGGAGGGGGYLAGSLANYPTVLGINYNTGSVAMAIGAAAAGGVGAHGNQGNASTMGYFSVGGGGYGGCINGIGVGNVGAGAGGNCAQNNSEESSLVGVLFNIPNKLGGQGPGVNQGGGGGGAGLVGAGGNGVGNGGSAAAGSNATGYANGGGGGGAASGVYYAGGAGSGGIIIIAYPITWPY